MGFEMDSRTSIETKLLGIIREFVTEFKSERAKNAVNLQAKLERDLGIDSLGRVELFLRIEKAFELSLPETLMSEAESVADIALALTKVPANEQTTAQTFVAVLEKSNLDPAGSKTLVEVLKQYAEIDFNRPHIYLVKEQGEEQIIRYGDLLTNAQKVAAGLLAFDLKPLETVAIMLPTSEDFFFAFFGVLLAGGIPVPIYPPVRADKLEEYAVREAKILNNAEVRVLITFSQAETLSKLLRVFIPSLKAVTTVPLLMKNNQRLPNLTLASDDPAMIQYTSGSTSDPKGVLLSHDNLLANIRAVGLAAKIGPHDVGVSWLPLYHDMGLIGAWFCSLYHGFPITIMSPLTFLSRPERWLWAIHYHRGTLSAGPNFAYELCIRKIREKDIEGLDLSSWRLAFNGAEAINPHTLARFTQKFAPYGFKPETPFPVYGLAECSVALTFPKLNEKPKTDIIQRLPFELSQQAVSASERDTQTLEFVNCGRALPEHEIRIVGENNQILDERQIGSLHFRGPSAMRGYYRNPQATKSVYREGWWDSGDFAYIAEGDVYITGRKKDIIIKAGRNLYPQEIEEVASQVSGIRKGCVVAFGIEEKNWGTEQLVIVAETEETNAKERDRLVALVNEKVSIVLGIPPDQVCLVSPRTIPKTSSGKLQRSACKELYRTRKLNSTGLPVWLQVSKLFMKGMMASVYNYGSKAARYLYTGYIGLLVLAFLPLFWLGILSFPRKLAMNFSQFLSKFFILLTGCPVKVVGREILKQDFPMIFISNHASYVDSLFLFAILPKNTLFVTKKEMLKWPVVGRMIEKFNFLTVDRIEVSKSIADTQVIVEKLKQGNSILLYPEGTFTYATGLRPFKIGAFKLAVDTGVPICPIAIQGTRGFMRGDRLLFTPKKINITVGEPISPKTLHWSEVARLHTEGRTFIANHCGELMIDLVKAGPEK